MACSQRDLVAVELVLRVVEGPCCVNPMVALTGINKARFRFNSIKQVFGSNSIKQIAGAA
jgi:hypothetical protein